jgi:RND superfamily putative drug exporter
MVMGVAAISRFVLSHKLLVGIAWVLITAVAFASTGPATDALSERFDLPGSESTEVNDVIAERYGTGGQAQPLVAVVELPEGTTVDTPGVTDELRSAFDAVQAAAPQVRIASFASTGDRDFVSPDGRTTFGLIFPTFAGPGSESPETPAVKAALDSVTVGGSPVLVTGMSELDNGGDGGEEDNSVLIETLVGGLGALIVMLWIFGSFLAFLPLVIAAVSIVTTFLLVWGLTAFTDVSAVVLFLIALIGLGVAIDYSLLVVTRWREERASGLSNRDAVQRAMETAGHAVIFSGTTVAIGLSALVVLPVPFIRSMGYASLLIPLVSVVVSITLLPVLLATVGPKLDWPRVRRGDQVSHAWERWAGAVVRRRWPAVAGAVVILAALVVPAFGIEVGMPRAESLAKSGEARDGVDALKRGGIGLGVMNPFEALVEEGAPSDPAAVAERFDDVDGVQLAVAPEGDLWRKDGSAIVVVLPDSDNSAAMADTLERLRDAEEDVAGSVRVGGLNATNIDLTNAVYSNFPLMLALITIVTFVLLVRAFRSLLLPLKAVILNVISVGAAYGVMVLVWQEGYGSELIWGIESSGAITAFVPIMAFSFLFGLSMDYEVFILTRMREEYDRIGNTDQAVVRGIGRTARLVTAAALILTLAFVALAAAPDTTVKIMATGLAAGIFLDATIVRALLVPATVSLMGKWNWWLPRWMERFAPAPDGETMQSSAAD